MEANTLNYSVKKRIKLLLVDDSELFRRFIIELLEDNAVLSIVAEASSGSQALEILGESKVDVVLLDMEMPGMGWTEVLQKIREHFPVPVIMVSSLSREGSARSFDTLKNGAVDFIGKDALHPKKGAEQLKKELLYRILCASRVQLKNAASVADYFYSNSSEQATRQRVIFCEDCGARNIVESEPGNGSRELRCSQCGDLLEATVINKYRRVSSIGVIGAGRGAAVNLLNIVPRLPADTSTAMIVVMHETSGYIESFTRYLNAFSNIKVVSLEEGINIEGGKCYIGSYKDHFSMVSHSTNYTIRKSNPPTGRGPLDQMFESISSIMKTRMLAVVLSGNQLDGDKGIQQVRQNHGLAVVLNAASCLCKELGENILRKSAIDRIVDEQDCMDLLLHFQDAHDARHP